MTSERQPVGRSGQQCRSGLAQEGLSDFETFVRDMAAMGLRTEVRIWNDGYLEAAMEIDRSDHVAPMLNELRWRVKDGR
jgi:hypothetical protein